MHFIAVDLGTTNVKVIIYDEGLNIVHTGSANTCYERNGDSVEFDAEQYYHTIAALIRRCVDAAHCIKGDCQIILTGQAESLVVIDGKGNPLMKAISWLDERSKAECAELQSRFDRDTVYATTGQVAILPTWPITKILWMKRHMPEQLPNIYKYLLVKDYVTFRLTGNLLGEYSVYNFSLYFDIRKRRYWESILDYCGVKRSQLPELAEPCTNAGTITNSVSKYLGLNPATTVNIGTLDHFAGMIGTGNITQGIISESTGTVLSVATLAPSDVDYTSVGIPCHCGPLKDTFIFLSVCESGGISLEWYRNTFMRDVSYNNIDCELSKRKTPGEILFLPYLTGVNAPDYNRDASGVFFGLKIKHDRYDLALAVMEGIAHLLEINIDQFRKMGLKIDRIISSGGGARSGIWSGIKAGITGCRVDIPVSEESACLGAAIIGAVSSGLFDSFDQAVSRVVKFQKTVIPEKSKAYGREHSLFKQLYNSLKEIYHRANDTGNSL